MTDTRFDRACAVVEALLNAGISSYINHLLEQDLVYVIPHLSTKTHYGIFIPAEEGGFEWAGVEKELMRYSNEIRRIACRLKASHQKS